MDQVPSKQDCFALANALALPADAWASVSRRLTPDFFSAYAPFFKPLTQPDLAADTWRQLETALSGCDSDGMTLFSIYLAAAWLARVNHTSRGIADTLILDTLKSLPRFLWDEQLRTGRLAFTRGFWAWRHLSGQIFRLGTLEFEYAPVQAQEPPPPGMAPGTPVLFVHIPSDALLNPADLSAAYAMAAGFYPGLSLCKAGVPQALLCNTWLLSPPLQQLLPPGSGIRQFAAGYDIYATDPEDDAYINWLFHGKTSPSTVPQQTSLQRKVYAHVQQGGTIGTAHGVRRL